jgi:hypothetical protein
MQNLTCCPFSCKMVSNPHGSLHQVLQPTAAGPVFAVRATIGDSPAAALLGGNMPTCPQCGNLRSRDSVVCRPCYIKNQTHPVAERFWSKVDRRGADECWSWKGGRRRRGYGIFSAGGSQLLAHRMAWQLSRGPIPPKMFICHHCDNPPCCNPAHLFIGSAADNFHDMIMKGRARSPIHKLTAPRHGMSAIRQDRNRGRNAPGSEPKWHTR